MNHKLLLSSTALVGAGMLFANAASAQDLEVTLGGYTEFGVVGATNDTLVDGESDRGFGFFMDNEVHIQATGTTDTGITYGSKVELEVGSGVGGDNAFVDEVGLFFSGAFGRIELGQEDGAEDVMFVDASTVAAGTGGIDGDLPNLAPFEVQDSGDATKATYFTPRVAGFQLGASYTPDFSPAAPSGVDDDGFGNGVGAGANWTGAVVGLEMTIAGVGHWAEQENPALAGAGDIEDWAVGFSTEFAGLALAGAYVQRMDFNEADIYNAGIGYGFGPFNTSVNYNYHDPDVGSASHFVVVGADIGLMPGVVLKGDVGWNSDDLGADPPGDESIAGLLAIQLNY